MKQENLVLVLALVAVGIALYSANKASKGGGGVTIIQAPRRTDAESVLTGVSTLIDKTGEAIGDVVSAWRPSAVGSSSSRG
jgi:aspartyl aminopeptidase